MCRTRAPKLGLAHGRFARFRPCRLSGNWRASVARLQT
ncbi:hypothetical protein C7S16_5188 [Burkholderia thailandensis]|uniref:Uncharacterized protein n=1 Tax=Burkholderia thailandensis TaxID=57975 RepID=A0AAW9CRW9_BURTH|nr:hypothetical protein [Burkholderia thailandensis]MDW9252927.1 hypothetical protein [Burkholderia thailandensis]